ncbi:MAG: hypothetical protein JWO70_2386 [Betaproteobacteria bacterium]|nr:hypothetical protein [Betaproteobacteria bacterium]
MKTLNFALLSLALAGGVALAPDADAYGGRYHSRGHVGVFIGAPIFPYYAPYYSPYYYPRYYYPPAVVSSPPVYIEQGSAAPAVSAPPAPTAQGASASWYYCRDSQTYYPYVQSCASPWQQVAPQASPPS